MSNLFYREKQPKLVEMMQNAGISSLEELSNRSGVSQWQLLRLQHGLLPKMPIEILVELSHSLEVSVPKLLEEFLPGDNPLVLPPTPGVYPSPEITPHKPVDTALEELLVQERESFNTEIVALKQEYAALQGELDSQKASLEQEFQQTILTTLEPWLWQWPTAAALAQKNPELSATKLLPLVKPILDLLKSWGVEPIGQIGEKVAYDPSYHELLEGEATPGEEVLIRYLGYTQGSKLLSRAKVTLTKPEEEPLDPGI